MKLGKWMSVVLMALIMIFLNADSNVIGAILESVESEFHVTEADLGLMSGLFSIFGALVSLTWGYMADKAHRKRLFLFSILVGEIPCLLTAFAPNYTIFFILRILTGIGVGAAFPLVYSMVGDIFNERERPLAATIVTSAFAIGAVVGFLVAGYLVDVVGWRLPFVLIAVPNFVFLFLFQIFIPNPEKGASEKAVGELIGQGYYYPKQIQLSDYITLSKIKTNLFLLAQGLLGTIPWGAVFLLINVFLKQVKGFSQTESITIFGLFGIGAILGNIVGGLAGAALFRRDVRLQPVFAGVTSILGSLLTLSLVFLIPSNFFLVAITGLVGATLVSMTGPNMRNMLLDTNVPENRGAIFSIFNLTDALGTGFGKLVSGSLAFWLSTLLTGALGLKFTMAISFFFWIPCGIILLFSAWQFPKDMDTIHHKMQELARNMKENKTQAKYSEQ